MERDCNCPAPWRECSYYNGTAHTLTALKLAKEWTSRHAFIPCSFEADPNCSPTPSTRDLYRLQLTDGTERIVTNVQINDVQVQEADVVCRQASVAGGTPEFCTKSPGACGIKAPPQYCYVADKNMITAGDSNTRFPIRAWGVQNVIFYGPAKHQLPTLQAIAPQMGRLRSAWTLKPHLQLMMDNRHIYIDKPEEGDC